MVASDGADVKEVLLWTICSWWWLMFFMSSRVVGDQRGGGAGNGHFGSAKGIFAITYALAGMSSLRIPSFPPMFPSRSVPPSSMVCLSVA